MHNIAIALHQLGHQVSGSDDEIFEPALSRLRAHGICPVEMGWYPDKITAETDFVILGMHARADNPELLKAKELGTKIYSFPDYVYEHAKEKTRIVIGGSHGKTTTTAMIMHVLKSLGKNFDYLVGSQLEGFDTMVRFSDAPIMVIEGDEYLTSALDRVPKFLKYKPHYAMLTGIAWDHINVFPVYEDYVNQFQLFAQTLDESGCMVYFSGDKELCKLKYKSRTKVYSTPEFRIEKGQTIVKKGENEFALEIFGEHNLQNAEGASLMCEEIGISVEQFYSALSNFSGTAKRLEKIQETEKMVIYRDFAHSPSKLKASVHAIRERYPDSEIFALYELHTFSSLNKHFLPEYQHCLREADLSAVYFNPKVIEHKKLEPIDNEDIRNGFIEVDFVFNNAELLKNKIIEFTSNVSERHRVLLVMSSGNFDNIPFSGL